MFAPLPPVSWCVQSRSARTRMWSGSCCSARRHAVAGRLADDGRTRYWWLVPVSRIVLRMRPPVAVSPHLQRGREPRGDRARDGAPSSSGSPRRLARARGRRRLAGRHRRAGRPPVRGARAGVEVLHRPGKEGLGKAYLAGFAHALERGAELVDRHGRGLLARPRPPARADRRRRGRRPRARARATWTAARSPTGRRCAALLSRCGSLYARTMLGVKIRDLTSGFRCVRRRGARGGRAVHARARRATSSTSS